MLNRYARAFFTRVLTPIARALLRCGVSPDVVTIVGTLGVAVCALVFFPRGQFVAGVLSVTAFVFSDLIDGTMARLSGRSSSWGAFLDSTLDRVGDAAIFGGLVLWFAGRGHDPLMAALTLYCVTSGAIVSYARARAEGLGMTANVGVVERAERLLGVLFSAGLTGVGVPYVLAIALWLIAAGSTVTLVQRMATVRRQAAGREADAGAAHPVTSPNTPVDTPGSPPRPPDSGSAQQPVRSGPAPAAAVSEATAGRPVPRAVGPWAGRPWLGGRGAKPGAADRTEPGGGRDGGESGGRRTRTRRFRADGRRGSRYRVRRAVRPS